MKREPTYRTGDPIREGDAVRIGAWDGVVETIITKESPGWEDYWRSGSGLTDFSRGGLRFHEPRPD